MSRLTTLLFTAFLMAAPLGASAQYYGQVPAPPRYVMPAPPAVVVIPGTYVYVIPGVPVDILFYGGSWYRFWEGHWYVSGSYNGPWAYRPPSRIPRPLLELPPGYRSVPPGYHHIPYNDFHRNWSRWERDRHWDRDPQWREGWHGRHEERGPERMEMHRGPEPRGQMGEIHRGPEPRGGGEHRGRP